MDRIWVEKETCHSTTTTYDLEKSSSCHSLTHFDMSSEGVLLQGQLPKLGGQVKKWRTRYVQVTKHSLVYFRKPPQGQRPDECEEANKAPPNLLNSVRLVGGKVMDFEPGVYGKPHLWGFQPYNKTRVYVFQGASDAHRDEWINLIEKQLVALNESGAYDTDNENDVSISRSVMRPSLSNLDAKTPFTVREWLNVFARVKVASLSEEDAAALVAAGATLDAVVSTPVEEWKTAFGVDVGSRAHDKLVLANKRIQHKAEKLSHKPSSSISPSTLAPSVIKEEDEQDEESDQLTIHMAPPEVQEVPSTGQKLHSRSPSKSSKSRPREVRTSVIFTQDLVYSEVKRGGSISMRVCVYVYILALCISITPYSYTRTHTVRQRERRGGLEHRQRQRQRRRPRRLILCV